MRSAVLARFILVGSALTWAVIASRTVPTRPRPTEVIPSQDETSIVHQREVWMESLHRTAPGTDWRSIEHENWRQILEGRRIKALITSWTEIGSLNLAGRTHQAAYDTSSGMLFVGTALGGVWRGTFNPASPNPGAMNWTPLSDEIYGGARGLVVFPSPSTTILKTQYDFFSGEVHRSTDGGAAWSVVASLNGQLKRILRQGGASNTVFLLARDCCAAQSWLYRSTDAGASFTLLRTLAGYEADIWTPRDRSGRIYLLTNNQLEVSRNNGSSWSVQGTIPMAQATRGSLTGSEAGSPRLYAVLLNWDETDRRLFRSDNEGRTWIDKGPVSEFWGDHVSLSASILNPDLVLYGGSECHRSTDGGTTFQIVNPWGAYYGDPATKLHADIDAIDFVSVTGNAEALFIGTDGGTYFSNNGGATVSNLSLQGLRVSQYYSTLSDASNPQIVAAGSQDQGYQTGSVASGAFEQVVSGDYGHLTSPDGTHQLVFAVYPFFVLAVEGSGVTHVQDFPAGEQKFWMPPLVADPRFGNVVYLGATRLYRYELMESNTWSVTQLPFNFQAQTDEIVSAIAIATADPQRWYVATNRGRLFFSTDAGGSWTPSLFASVPDPQYLTGLGIAVHPLNPNLVAIGGSGYSNPGIFLSSDGGATFSPLGANQPQTLVFDLEWGPAPSFDLYAATESGPWQYTSATGTWSSLLQSVAPMTSYWSVERVGTRMRFGTYGRGAWDFDACAGVAVPAGSPTLTMGKHTGTPYLTWTGPAGATAYDVVTGSLGALRSSGGNFTMATTTCVANDVVDSAMDVPTASSPGQGLWYLVRGVNCAGTGTYDSGSPRQQGGRDAEVNAAAASCP